MDNKEPKFSWSDFEKLAPVLLSAPIHKVVLEHATALMVEHAKRCSDCRSSADVWDHMTIFGVKVHG